MKASHMPEAVDRHRVFLGAAPAGPPWPGAPQPSAASAEGTRLALGRESIIVVLSALSCYYPVSNVR